MSIAMADSSPTKRSASLQQRPLRLLLLGANPESANRGVAALGIACLDNVSAAFPGARILASVTGMQWKREVQLPDHTVTVESCSVHASDSLRVGSSTEHVRFVRQLRRVLPGLGTRWLPNRTLQQLLDCDAVLDIAGGDSFADTYTSEVFAAQVALKRLVLEMDKPLILLPQTYGPFHYENSQRLARQIMAQSALVATRDVFGLEELRGLMGGALDDRFVRCPDVAYTLRPMPVAEDAVPWPVGEGLLIGLNVSGLLWDSNVNFRLESDYRELTRSLIGWAMAKQESRLLLVPHVFNQRTARTAGKPGALAEDSEFALCRELAGEAGRHWGRRVAALDQPYTAPQLKTIIGRCDFFVGARMHACIAGVSQSVPTITLAYSKKAAGVMGHLGVAEAVLDLRQETNESCLAKVDQMYRRRAEIRMSLTAALPAVQQLVREFFSVHMAGAMRKLGSGPLVRVQP